MGASEYGVVSRKPDVAVAFKACVEQAGYENGYGGYTGTIAEKGHAGYNIIKSEPVSYEEAVKIEQSYYTAEEDSEYGQDHLLDKWGPANAIALKFKDGSLGWYFWGLASD